MAISVCTRQCCSEGCLGRGGSGGFCGTRGYTRGPFMNDLTQTPEMLISNMGQRARRAAALLAGASDAQKAQALRSAAQALRDGEPDLIAAHPRAMAKGATNGLSPAMLEPQKLDSDRTQAISG